jgi:hypothetical protein
MAYPYDARSTDRAHETESIANVVPGNDDGQHAFVSDVLAMPGVWGRLESRPHVASPTIV